MKKVIYENKTIPIYTGLAHNLGPQPHLHKEIEIFTDNLL